MKAVIVITGSLRDQEQFDKAVDSALKVRDACPFVKEVRLSTTDPKGVVDRGTAKWRIAGNLKVFCAEPPTVVVRGHRLHQMLQLRNGIADLDPDDWVIKVRTDKLILPPEVLVSCISRVMENPGAYSGKFGILEGHLFLPWYVNDMVFMGQASSVGEIVSFDVSCEVFAPGLATEQAIWGRLLGNRIDTFYQAARRYPQTYRFSLEECGNLDPDKAFGEIRDCIFDYWAILSERFFAITSCRFSPPASLRIGGVEIDSEQVFTRYGTWGSSFTEPSILGAIRRPALGGSRMRSTMC